jgi:two-component system CheB/CheR fusion protein
MVATASLRLRDYVRYVTSNPDEYQRLTSTFLIKVTEFFRDPELFDTVRDRLLPELIDEARERKELRVWSAGCATGEEAYSLAMIVRDALGDEIGDWAVRIFATDLDGEAVAFARRGVYPAAAVSRLPDDLVARHFTRLDGEYEVRPELRALVVFGQHDLALRAPFPRIDLIVCRNVLIYFTEELQRRALEVFAFSLRDRGVLLLGKAETTTPLAEHFLVDDQRLKIFRRHGERTVIPAFRLRAPATTSMLGFRPRTSRRIPEIPRLEPALTHLPARSSLALASLPIGVAVVTRDYDIEYLNPVARRLLGIHGSAIGQDVVHLAATVPATELQAALDDSLAGRTATITSVIRTAGDDTPRAIEITCGPILEDAEGGQPSGAVIAVRDITAERSAKDDLARALAREDEQLASITNRLEMLREESRRIGAANEELAASNADLRAANEELLVATEEVQAVSEEVETLNEELQATNEELETLNEELQATVEELNTTNDDLQARGAELQEMATDLEEQRRYADAARARVAAVIESLNEAVLVVDDRGQTVVRNETFRRLFDVEGLELRDADGKRITLTAVRTRAVAGMPMQSTFSSTDDSGRHRWFELHAGPVPAEMGIGAGAIIVVRDTTDISVRRLQEEFVGVVAHELRTPLTALRGYLQMLSRRNMDADSLPKLGLAIEQAERLHHLVDELFDITRADTGRLQITPEPTDLRSVIADTVEIARGLSDRHRFSVEQPDAPLLVMADPNRIEQVLLNLLSNSVIHAPDAPDVSIRLRRLRRRAEIEIEDRGPGISPDVQQRLFMRFERGDGRGQGLGLGLYISRQIVQAHAGTLDIDSAPGEGATFTIRLPLAPTDGSATRDTTDGAQAARLPPIGEGARADGPKRLASRRQRA